MKNVYKFGFGGADGTRDDAELLGGKGANLAEMCRLGVSVPPGITIPTTTYAAYLDAKNKEEFIRLLVLDEVIPGLSEIVANLGHWPLWSVRSGAANSMPGMMDTILNVGHFNSSSSSFWNHQLGEAASLDCRRRLIRMYAGSVEGLDCYLLDKWLRLLPTRKYGGTPPGTMDAALQSLTHMRHLVANYEKWFAKHAGYPFPDTLEVQLQGCIKAVFDSWDNPRARAYRQAHGISHDLGTAVNIQEMVFGNLGENSCSGVAFTRDPATGEDGLVGEYLCRAQGEDIVSGSATPKHIATMPHEWLKGLEDNAELLEKHYGDMLDIEFTVEDGTLYLLQCRVGKRTPKAAFRIAVDLVEEGVIDKKQAKSRVSYEQYKALTTKVVDLDEVPKEDYTGIAAGGGLVCGEVVTSSKKAVERSDEGASVILVTDETNPDDFPGMQASVGILTRTGGLTSHAAVVARGMGKTCVVGCTELPDLKEGEVITLDGSNGGVWLAELPLVDGQGDEYVAKFMEWAMEGAEDYFIQISPADELPKKAHVIAGSGVSEEEFSDFLLMLQAIDFEGAVLDLHADLHHPDDALLNQFFQIDSIENVDKKVWLLEKSPYEDLKDKVFIRVDRSKADEEILRRLDKASWKTVKQVGTVEELLRTSGIVEPSTALVDAVGGEYVVDDIISLMRLGGISAQRFQTVSRQNLLREAFKKP